VSYLLGIYFRDFANYNATYGTLGAAIAFSVWMFWSNFIMLIGAEINSKLLQRTAETSRLRSDRRRVVTPKPPNETDLAA
jgi:uncharacterized BrkB/YihY/UPF0761 family membrane protein